MRTRPITPQELGRTPTPDEIKRVADAAAMLADTIREAHRAGRPLPNILDRNAVRDALDTLDAALDRDGTGRLVLYRDGGGTWPPAAVGQHLIGLDRLRRHVAGRVREGDVPTVAAADALTALAAALARCAAVEAAEPAARWLDWPGQCVHLDGEAFRLTPAQARLVKALAEARDPADGSDPGGQWVSGKNLPGRPDHRIAELPPAVQALIDRPGRGRTGYRLNVDLPVRRG